MQLLISLCIIVLCVRLHPVESLSIHRKSKFDYDLIVIGAGASGMFAAGTASSFGYKTLLVDKYDLDSDLDFQLGGDCTNSACVPSKAVRCAARIAAVQKTESMFDRKKKTSGFSFSTVARAHARKTTNAVRARESPKSMASSPNLDIVFSPQVFFDAPRQLSITNPYLFNSTFSGFLENNQDSNIVQIRAKQFIICTGAGPTIPPMLKKSAKKIGLPLLTYRSFFRPDGEGMKSDFLWDMPAGKKKQVVIVGGGPTACEIAQSLSRLNENVNIIIVAPSILPSEDIAARAAARKILQQDGITIIDRRRVVGVSRMSQIPLVELDDKSQMHVDVLICAMGRDPGQNLEDMQLEKAGIEWTQNEGIIVDSKLKSVSSKHVFAAGDCASAVPKTDRRASHAGWTGYHAVQSALFPRFLLPADTIHPYVPRVVFLDPEIASIGMTRAECVDQFGTGGFNYLKVSENGTDRADIDSIERSADGFVELRQSLQGRILGATVCSPSASEIINELSVVMANKMTSRDIAKSIHVYPSYGYLMHRVALSLAMSDIWGVLAACGPIGRTVGGIGRRIRFRKKKSAKRRAWEAVGTDNELDYHGSSQSMSISYLEASKDASFCESVRRNTSGVAISERSDKEVLLDFIKWLDSKPSKY